MIKVLYVGKRVFHYYNSAQVPMAAAALCYYLTMTFFPLVICLYTLLGYNYATALSILSFAEGILSTKTVQIVRTFLSYVARNHSTTMLVAGAVIMLTYSSAAVRSMQVTIGRIQGRVHFRGPRRIIISLLISLIFMITAYFSILVMITSRDLLNLVNRYIPFIDISAGWMWIKYILLFGMLFLMIWCVFRFSRLKGKEFSTWPGALLSTLALVGMSFAFSAFIAVSVRYPLVYGSLASLILLMLWMYFAAQIIYVGAAFNMARWDLRHREDAP